ncbi:mechanosensitive ion channel family protein [Aestuariispira insulae]|uniref:Small-conductance mechanosensitive channel n=1 Tax=Aestuariispira insulae TaxID=1461337 RepID=A0A3D9HHL9_9PROT|nr:mechanosensitive ion channel family protein [Aestuariispira insulae]RED49042.1 small-conductance mechanosensitive channel [Aestuariispira insulae]
MQKVARGSLPNWLLLICFLLSSAVAQAAGLTATHSPLEPVQDQSAQKALDDNPEAALARLSDAEVRALLLERLRERAPDAEKSFNPAITAFQLQGHLGRLHSEASAIFGAFPELPGIFPRAFEALNQDRGKGGVDRFLLAFIAALVIGAGAEYLLRRRMKAAREAVRERTCDSDGEKAAALGFLLVTDLLGIFLFTLATVGGMLLLAAGDGYYRTTFVFYMAAILIIRLVITGADIFFCPDHPNLRIPHYSDRDAGGVRRAVSATVILGAFGYFSCALFGVLGIGGRVHQLLLILVGTMITLGMMATVILGRHALKEDLLHEDQKQSMIRLYMAAAWPWAFAAIIALIWIGVVLTALLGLTPHYGAALFSIALLLLAPGIIMALEREARRFIAKEEEVRAAMLRAAKVCAFVATIVFLAMAWRIDVTGMAGSGLSGQVVNALFQVGVTILVAYVCWSAARIWIDKKIAEEDKAFAQEGMDLAEMEIGGTGLSRIRTLLPLAKRTVQITIGAIAVIVALSALGVDIGPLLAGAGVVGLAVGFGSQALVRDIVSGLFFLLDDAFRLGEYVSVGHVKGSVEKITIRSFQLRHHLGAVNTVPFGEIRTLSNFSRDWAIMKLPFRVTFDTDIEKVRKVIKKVGLKLLEHPEIGEDFIQPFKSQGVLEVDDYGLVVRAKFMCKPGRQFLIRRYAFMAVQEAFAQNGIEFARPEIRVRAEENDDAANAEKVKQATRQMEAGAAHAATRAQDQPEKDQTPS